MEGPSLFLAAEQLSPFVGQKINAVFGNTRIGKERLLEKQLISLFSYGKYLFFQFDEFALRVHFLLFGSFEVVINGIKVTGDYPKKARIPRLAMQFKIGQIDLYSCSIHYIEEANARQSCDYAIDIMSELWNESRALKKIQTLHEMEIGDVLLDQSIFLGVGNIIKNEVLLLAKISPLRKIMEITPHKLRKIISITRNYVFDFYRWRKEFELKKHYRVYRQSTCKVCGNKVSRIRTGIRKRLSFICSQCQK